MTEYPSPPGSKKAGEGSREKERGSRLKGDVEIHAEENPEPTASFLGGRTT